MSNSPASPPSVLVVDDQEENIKVVGSVLSIMGYEVIPALSGEQAFKRLGVRLPDLILLDVMMPGTDGLAVCRELKGDARWSEIPVIFLSAADDKNLIVQALESGGVDYVTKPFSKAELVSRVRTHLSLKLARDELRQLVEDRDELLGILTHDLKNHLAGVQLSAQLLRDSRDPLPPRALTLARNIADTADASLGFLRTFLANHSAGRLEVEPAPCDLAAECASAVGRATSAAEAKQIELRLNQPPESVCVLADASALAQVLDNLLSNALKFSPRESVVDLTVAIEILGEASVTVRDRGPGFTEEDRGRMFRRYGRLSARPTAGEASTGLGLYIVKRLVEAMKGRVSVESAPGEGAAITIQLPRGES